MVVVCTPSALPATITRANASCWWCEKTGKPKAFIEQRKHEKNSGAKIGPMTLFFGGRHAHAEYYYRDECAAQFEKFEAEGLVKCCNAWSRDQKQKAPLGVYVQHKIMEEAVRSLLARPSKYSIEDSDAIWANLGREGSKGYFFLCGSKQPEKDAGEPSHIACPA
eukprot:Skav201407  [mRNA]  locus=scaffold4679:15781:19286:- [translate_table: standard]